jgi:hypothetical protein
MDSLSGTVGPDLAEVYANGHEHTWTLTLYGTTQSHSTYSTWFGYLRRATEIHATSFDLEFFGPDAATLNGIVSEHIAGGDVSVYLENAYSSGFGNDFAVWDVSVFGPDVEFWTEELSWGWNPLFPADAEGYPVVGPDPLTIWAEYNILIDNRPGNDGSIWSEDSLVTFEGSVGPLPGDFNGDGDVDAADLAQWEGDFGLNGDSDSDGDGDSDGADFLAWQRQLGATPTIGAATTSIPEPATLLLVVSGAFAMLLRRHVAGSHKLIRL